MAVIHVRGELDRASVPELATRVKEVLAADSPCRTLILDLCGLRFMDVGGMCLLLDAHEHATGSGVAYPIVGCLPRALRVLRITRTADLLPVAPPRPAFAPETQWRLTPPCVGDLTPCLGESIHRHRHYGATVEPVGLR